MWFGLLLVAVCTSQIWAKFPVPRSTIAQSRATSEDYRLPTHVTPVHYNVALEPFFDNFTFNGYVQIEVEVTEEASNITLHANTLTINESDVSLVQFPSTNVPITNVTFESEKHFLIIYANVSSGAYYINIVFTGILNDNNNGFYRASYTDKDGNTRYRFLFNLVTFWRKNIKYNHVKL